MNLAEYSTLCTKIGDFCEYARRRAPFGEVELLERAAALEAALLEEYNAHGENLALACVELAGSPARVELVARYRQNMAVFGQIRPLIDDLAGGAVSCPENLKARLIWALNGLCSLCSDLSGVCLREFDKIAPQKAGEGKTVPELIESTPGALAIAQAVAVYLTGDYKPKAELTRRERGLIGREIGKALGFGHIDKVGQYWGFSGKELSREAGKAEFDCSPKIIALKELLRGAGVEI